jgi:1-pyrroline-5-carboxylate dehydrogenase
MAGAHSFGGFSMSGTDSKAGGPDYLLLFLQAKAIGTKLEWAALQSCFTTRPGIIWKWRTFAVATA